MEYRCPFISKRCKESPQWRWKKKVLLYITQEKGFETGDTTDERWFLSTSRNSPRKGTCKIYKTFDRIFNFWTYQDLTCQGKAISIEMCMVFQRVAEPNNSSLLENKVDFVHSVAIFDYFALKCILSKLNFTFIFDTQNAQLSHKFVGYNNSTDHGKAVF